MDVIGTNSVDTLTGTKGDDFYSGLGGSDTINATQGNDVVDGGSGNDRLTILMGNLLRFDAFAGARTFWLTSSLVSDSAGLLHTTISSIERLTFSTVGTGDYDDIIDASGFTSAASIPVSITTGAGNDTITGTGVNDTIFAGRGSNWVDAGGGFDEVRFSYDSGLGGTMYVTGSGNQLQTSFNGQVNTALNAETIYLANDNPSFGATIDASGYTGPAMVVMQNSNSGSDVFIGHNGVDFFATNYVSTVGGDTYTGNGGADIYDYTYAVAAMDGDLITDFDSDDLIDLAFNTPTNNGGGLLANQFIGAAEFTGVAGQYRFTVDVDDGKTYLQVDTDGDCLANQTLTIANGNFSLAETSAGSNQLHLIGQSGSNGDDFLLGSRDADDTIYAQAGDDIIAATGGMDHIHGGDGFDQLRFITADGSRFVLPWASRTITVTDDWVGASDGTINSYHYDVESLFIRTTGTGDHGDTIDASALTNAALVLRLGAGNDTVVSGSGDDSLSLGMGINTVDAGAGEDTVFFNFDSNGGVPAYITRAGETVLVTVNGVTVASAVNAEFVHIEGQNSGGVTTVIDASDFAPIAGTTLVLRDSNGSDIIIGSSGTDYISNVSTHSTGSDTFTGNGGADVFDWTFASDNIDGDVITDLDGDDTLDFRFNDGGATGGSPLLCNQFVGMAAFSGVAGQYRFTTSGGQTLIQVDTDGDSIADQSMTIANGSFNLVETFAGSNILHLVGQVVTGTNSGNALVTTLGDDIVNALGGNDTIQASQGHDLIDGGNGIRDTLNVSMSSASRFATPATGSRTYVVTNGHIGDASSGLDTSFANCEIVTLTTRATGDFGDTIDATSDAGGFALNVNLGDGNDTFLGGGASETINTGLGTDTINFGSAGGLDVARVMTSASSTHTTLTGSGDTAQVFEDGTLRATITGSEEIWLNMIADTFATDGVTRYTDASGYTGSALVYHYDHNGDDVDIGSAGRDLFVNLFNATVGTDTFRGNGGADWYDYAVAVNALNDDVILDFDADDTIDFQSNDGSLSGTPLCYLWLGAGAFTGVAGQYRYSVAGSETQIQIDTNGDMITDRTLHLANAAWAIGETSAGSNQLHVIGTSGTSGADTMTGTLGNDSFYAQAGNDIINGSQGVDYIDGGAGGGDRLFMNTGTASLFAAASGARTYVIGATTITDSSGTLNTTFTAVERIAFSTVGNGNFNDTIDASGFVSLHNSALDIRLGNGTNTVTGSASNDRLFTGLGSTVADGGGGFDVAQVGMNSASALTITLTSVGGTVIASGNGVVNQLSNFEQVVVFGVGTGTVTLDASGYVAVPGVQLFLGGHDGTDIMIGSSGDDFFANATGQHLGNDVYTGHGGADIYDYTFAADSMNGDTIMDFDIDDVIDLRFNNLEAGGSPLLANLFIGASVFSGTAGEYRYQIDGTTTVVQVDSNGDGTADQTLTIANGGFTLAETAPGSDILTLAAVINPLDGVVADGYIAGATLFVDVNGNGVRDNGEAWTTTDANGNFALNVNQAGTIVATGGLDLGTGLANRMDLKAPYNADVVNPLTTLIAAVIASTTMSATQAEAEVKASLGLDASLDLLNTDLLAAGNGAAILEAQKVAALIANLATTAETVSGADGGTETDTLAALAQLVIGTGEIDLTDQGTLNGLLVDALPAGTNVGAVAGQLASEGDAIEAAGSLAAIMAAQTAAALTGDDLDNTLTGNDADNILHGNGGADKLYGLGGNDTLDGGTGADWMEGGLGSDLYIVDKSGDRVIELSAAGIDTVRSSISYTLGANVENLELSGSATSGTGNGDANIITGNGLANILNGGGGNDTLLGGGGNDRLNGDAGNDLLRGGDGLDTLSGGAGTDRFIVDYGTPIMTKQGPLSLDLVLDFQTGDKIDLSFLDANSLLSGDQDFAFKGSSVSKDAGTVWFKTYDTMQGAEKALGADIDGASGASPYGGPVTILFGNYNGGDPDFAIALVNVGSLQAHDLLMG